LQFTRRADRTVASYQNGARGVNDVSASRRFGITAVDGGQQQLFL